MHEKKLIKPFFEASYLSQVRRLRVFSEEALKRYRLKVVELKFINHAENATFKVTASDGSRYLLRVHRFGYHTNEAISEELRWLSKLTKSRFLVPEPVLSKNRKLIEEVSVPELDLTRNCCLFRWVDGKFINKSVHPKHMYKIGELLAKLQESAPKTIHRRYWDAEGLLGKKAKFGSIDSLGVASKKEQIVVTEARKSTLAKLKKYEAKHPTRSGLIHADFHFGNLLAVGPKIGAIDFDDCGYGFFVYDLVIPYMSMQNILGNGRVDELKLYRKALIEGYKTVRKWDKDDEDLFPYLVTARKLLMLGWLNSRSDNPNLHKQLKNYLKKTLEHIASENVV